MKGNNPDNKKYWNDVPTSRVKDVPINQLEITEVDPEGLTSDQIIYGDNFDKLGEKISYKKT